MGRYKATNTHSFAPLTEHNLHIIPVRKTNEFLRIAYDALMTRQIFYYQTSRRKYLASQRNCL